MTPFYSKGRRFKFEDDLDKVLITFISSINLFDTRIRNLDKLRNMSRVKAFKKVMADFDYPEIWKQFHPPAEYSRIIDPNETKALFKKLKEILKQNNKRSWKKTARQFLDNYFGEYCADIDWICTTVYHQSVIDLLKSLQESKVLPDRQKILIDLVNLDIGFLSHPSANQIINESVFLNENKFKTALAKAIESKSGYSDYEHERNRHALLALSSLGYRQKSYKDWTDFFKYFNSQLGDKSGILRTRGFYSFESTETLIKAIKNNNIPKDRQPGGRKKSS